MDSSSTGDSRLRGALPKPDSCAQSLGPRLDVLVIYQICARPVVMSIISYTCGAFKTVASPAPNSPKTVASQNRGRAATDPDPAQTSASRLPGRSSYMDLTTEGLAASIEHCGLLNSRSRSRLRSLGRCGARLPSRYQYRLTPPRSYGPARADLFGCLAIRPPFDKKRRFSRVLLLRRILRLIKY